MEENSFSELDKTILPWLGRTMKALDHFLNDQFESHGLNLTKAQFVVLKVLSHQSSIAQNNLAFITNRDKTSLTRLIDTMEKKGLVIRSSDPNDKRIKLVSITTEGKSSVKTAIPMLHETIKKIQTDIDPADLQTTIEVFKKISKNINADELTAPINQ
ncbi:MarR family transcriptional regulator [Reichenbachiella carrageenanivorans]|uniref:MarR family transcriptional regulator n=1 Tax=Reichenbachiella carrageenanivorans TaxID=2979869 RepID=A0ABY6D0I9_9BACT|nr:MarR family transcriptional regulator [Reichenbachiella carrageenanivorans]UXX79690.1 MarR family transcriptional regulator [Reichenbachiella carrageenanivorans]